MGDGSCDGAADGSGVGAALGTGVGICDGAADGSGVGVALGIGVGFGVGAGVVVGIKVGTGVGRREGYSRLVSVATVRASTSHPHPVSTSSLMVPSSMESCTLVLIDSSKASAVESPASEREAARMMLTLAVPLRRRRCRDPSPSFISAEDNDDDKTATFAVERRRPTGSSVNVALQERTLAANDLIACVLVTMAHVTSPSRKAVNLRPTITATVSPVVGAGDTVGLKEGDVVGPAVPEHCTSTLLSVTAPVPAVVVPSNNGAPEPLTLTRA